MMSHNDLTNRLHNDVIVADGAMGTMLYQRGVFVNTCFDSLNLSRPDLIEGIHGEYVNAGCDLIETNTFGANRMKLGRFGLAEQCEQINRRGVEIARKAAKQEVLVAGSVGPSGCDYTTYSNMKEDELLDIFGQQITALAQGGADVLILETFTNLREIITAAKAAAKACDLPIIAQLAVGEDFSVLYAECLSGALINLAKMENIAAVGFNCCRGPADMLECVQACPDTALPLSIQPNAGYAQEVDGRTMYMCTPEYMAEYAKRFYEHGARIIGGCCGTGPEHIGQIVKAVRGLHKAQKVTQAAPAATVTVRQAKEQAHEPIPLEAKSRIGKKIAQGEKVLSIEITPPRGVDLSKTIAKVRRCAEFGIDAINIPDGPRASSRLSPMITAIQVAQSADIEVILHVCCRDRNIIGIQSDMLGAHTIGLKNVLLVTGDPPKLGEFPDATAVFDLDSIALTDVVSRLNRGIDISGGNLGEPLGLTIGVGANPVASDLHREIDRFKAKVDAGAEYAITQPVFDVEMLHTFMAAVESHSIPIIAGIWPFTSYKNAEFMANEVPGVVVPDALLTRMSKAKTKEQGRKIGIEIAQEMIEQIEGHVAGYAVSAPFGNVDIALAVLGKIDPDSI